MAELSAAEIAAAACCAPTRKPHALRRRVTVTSYERRKTEPWMLVTPATAQTRNAYRDILAASSATTQSVC